MTCRDFENLHHLYVDDTLDVPTVSQLEEHLRVCENCSREVDYLRAVTLGVESYPVLEAPADLLDNVMTQIEGAKTIWDFSQERAYLFRSTDLLSHGKLGDLPKGLLTILFDSMMLPMKVYIRVVNSALRYVRERIAFNLASIDFRKLMKRESYLLKFSVSRPTFQAGLDRNCA